MAAGYSAAALCCGGRSRGGLQSNAESASITLAHRASLPPTSYVYTADAVSRLELTRATVMVSDWKNFVAKFQV